MSFYFIFIDGIGLGDNEANNPLALNSWLRLGVLKNRSFFNNGENWPDYKSTLFKEIDANLNVEGFPQSGTGQTTLFTGSNASKIVGRHFGPYPHSKCKKLLREGSLFLDMVRDGFTPCFANAYPHQFFDINNKTNRWSCTTYMSISANILLFTEEEVKKEIAITAEIKQDYWRSKLKIDLPVINEKQAATRFYKLGKDKDLVLFEYYLTDKAGHEMDECFAKEAIGRVDRFIDALLFLLKDDDVVLITSDHGNIEDLAVKTHTRNPIPLIVSGFNAHLFCDVNSLVDIKEAVLNWLKLVEKK